MKTVVFSKSSNSNENYKRAKEYADAYYKQGYWVDIVSESPKFVVYISASEPNINVQRKMREIKLRAEEKARERIERDKRRLANEQEKAERAKRQARIKIAQAQTKAELVKANTALKRAKAEERKANLELKSLRFSSLRGTKKAFSALFGSPKRKKKKSNKAKERKLSGLI